METGEPQKFRPLKYKFSLGPSGDGDADLQSLNLHADQIVRVQFETEMREYMQQLEREMLRCLDIPMTMASTESMVSSEPSILDNFESWWLWTLLKKGFYKQYVKEAQKQLRPVQYPWPAIVNWSLLTVS